jgi:hypothetical protein
MSRFSCCLGQWLILPACYICSPQIISVVILALAGVAVLNYEGEWIEVISGTSFAIVAGESTMYQDINMHHKEQSDFKTAV